MIGYRADGQPVKLLVATGQKAIVGATAAEIGAAVEVEFGVTSLSVAIVNTAESDDVLEISYDGGESWYPLAANEAVDDPIELASVHVRGSAAAVPYKMRVRY